MVKKAVAGDATALEEVIVSIQDLVYNLSLKMLLFPEDAQDASQEILVKIATHLNTYRGESKFTTWVYKVASNYLITEKGKKSREFAMSFEDYSLFIDSGQVEPVRFVQNEGELMLLEEEIKISCTQELLLCLKPLARVVFILGGILRFTSIEGGKILAISPKTSANNCRVREKKSGISFKTNADWSIRQIPADVVKK